MNPLAVLREHLEELQKLGASKIGIFGSHATGKANSKSDVDIYVEFNDSKRTYDNFFALHELLEKLLQSRIDLVTDKSLTPSKALLILPTVRYVS